MSPPKNRSVKAASMSEESVEALKRRLDEAARTAGTAAGWPPLADAGEAAGPWAVPEVAPFMARWKSLAALRDAVNDHLEAARQAGTIGGSLDAEVRLHARLDGDADLARHAELAALGDELRFALITSGAALATLDADAALPDGAAELAWSDADGATHRWAIEVVRSAHTKCPRCWHHRDDVGSNADHPELCGRCVTNAFGAGETRRHA